MSPEKWNTDVPTGALAELVGYTKEKRVTINSRIDSMLTQAGSISGVLAACIEKVDGPSPGDCSQPKSEPLGVTGKLTELSYILNEIEARARTLAETL